MCVHIANNLNVFDWEFWIEALREAGVLAQGFKTVAYNYIGSELTWPIYWNATLGKAKEDLDRARASIAGKLDDIEGEAQVAVLKAVVSQASAAIPVVPLYISVLFKVMKEAGNHECILEHVQRLFSQQLYGTGVRNIDDVGRIRVDDWELSAAVQDEVKRRWPLVSTENLEQLADLAGYRSDFLKIFGFGLEGVDYEADVDPLVAGIASES
jgi:enoyl-[acyl-carrier protein] reductase/trans-2-enoyl-CoA reductase (NAD+)